ncbi:MAG: DNA helicase RecQ [Cellulosilyticaceae bacterium]
MHTLEKAQELLKQYFGYDQFRKGQEEIITHLLEGQDALGIMPTGAGKSICYQIPAMVMEGMTIVISPLISLMKDQVDALGEVGIPAGVLNSSLSALEYKQVIEKAMDGKYKLLYVAPERLDTVDFLTLSMEVPIAMVAVDEAHCVSQWGHDFRPSYTQIASYIRRLPKRPIVAAFTATATPKVKEDIGRLIELQNPYTLVTGFDRPNLYFEVQKPQHKYEWIANYLDGIKEQCGVIYCATRKNVDALYERLLKHGIKVSRYHAGLPEGERKEQQEAFLYDQTQIMVATNAFGMGIDKSNIRFVIHYNMPKNMESYYQEAGRGGRDGVDAKCILLYSAADIMTNRLLIENSQDTRDLAAEYEKLNQMVDYCNTEGCLRSYILQYFGEEAIEACGKCGNCQSEVEKRDITIDAQKILSCIKRMGERFGSGMVVDVLKGSNTQKIRQFRFDTLSTYGLMADYTKEVIKEMMSFLIAEKYIGLEGGEYPTLALTPRAYGVLKGQEEVWMRLMIQKEQVATTEVTLPIDEVLLSLLSRLRKEMADEQHVPPFMVFSDATLYEMATYFPTTEEEMLRVSGVGQMKYEKYGQRLEKAIATYVEENEIQKPERPLMQGKKKNTKAKGTSLASGKGETHKVTYKLYTEGLTISDIAKERDLSIATIENHLVKAIEEGYEVDDAHFMTPEQRELIEKAIGEVGEGYLKPIKELLPEEISYTAIKFVIAKNKKN